jgi:hypothetical protein
MSRRLTFPTKGTLCLSFFFLLYTVQSQQVKVVEISTRGGDVIVDYELLDDNKDHRYTLNLYTSVDNYIQPLKEVEGDIGIDLSVGGNKRVVWHVAREFGEEYKGIVALELKGKLYIPFVTLNEFDKFNKVKRDRPYNITWAAGRGSNVLTWDLYNAKDELVHTFTNVANVGEYELIIPKDVSPGKGYYMMISDQRNKEDVIKTPGFQIRRKIPLYVNASLIGLGLASGYLLVNSLGNDEVPPAEGGFGDPITPTN